jgi:hypothetical protein
VWFQIVMCFHNEETCNSGRAAQRIGSSGFPLGSTYIYISVLPGGRNFGQKAQKGPEKNNVGWKNLGPNTGRIFTKSGRKGAVEYFLNKCLI